jgi:hypothetical protein
MVVQMFLYRHGGKLLYMYDNMLKFINHAAFHASTTAADAQNSSTSVSVSTYLLSALFQG